MTRLRSPQRRGRTVWNICAAAARNKRGQRERRATDRSQHQGPLSSEGDKSPSRDMGRALGQWRHTTEAGALSEARTGHRRTESKHINRLTSQLSGKCFGKGQIESLRCSVCRKARDRHESRIARNHDQARPTPSASARASIPGRSRRIRITGAITLTATVCRSAASSVARKSPNGPTPALQIRRSMRKRSAAAQSTSKPFSVA